MASVATSHFVSRSAYSAVPESKAALAQIDLKTLLSTHNGLRSLNKADMLQMKSNSKALTKNVRSKVSKTPNDLPHRATIRGMNIVFVATECDKFCKTGGLGDVVGGLPPALAKRGHRAMAIIPRYDQYKDAWDTNELVELKVGDSLFMVRLFHTYKRGVDIVFVDHPMFLEKVWGKTGSKLYGPTAGSDFDDNQIRFSLLCLAALEAPRVLNLNNNPNFSGPYGEDIVFVANDWHTGLLPCYLKSMYQSKGIYKNAKVVFCIHNIAYQGRFAFDDFSKLGLPDEFKGSFDFIDGHVKPVKGRKINWMKAGILESDRVVTVSPYYAQELLSGPAKGVELDNVCRVATLTGITNGTDTQIWNPSTDEYICVNYDKTTVMDAKPLLKEALQAETGLEIDPTKPLIGFIGRLEEQKGSDILTAAIPEFIGEDVQIIVLGTGKKAMEKQIEELEIKYPGKAIGVAKFNSPLAHMIIAGADYMLIPSRFEPCGLVQLHAMSYGTLPIVASTGGLVDTVKEGYTGFQMGAFSVECDTVDPQDVTAVATTVKRALKTYGTPAMKEMIQNCMSQDVSWKEPAKLWEKLLLSLEVPGSEPGVDAVEEITPKTEKVTAAV
ncbi:granule-bound starch synthase 1, chloroplastic/amyloplastic-like [Amaranthus tricolor]|uniref:granule-bound starch synthase 1, chloroplastic/amyloplastic-like n=1 Tax=Amaranthus tricolor TaxID=29722 RepID=UPI002590C7C7|nr:granule-bound starch synthase 1, chloroplastic/amyloplastic-like [Amaranthus tricolor]